MKLAEIDITNQRHGVLEGTQYQLSTDSAAVSVIFRTLVSGLYTNKKRAPLREYWTNALDESQEVHVHLPSLLDPRVVIRDFGPGLSHERVMHHFTQIGGSDKRDSNEKTGTLGYGSKSAFAYTEQFTIRSFYNGEVRVYISTMEKNFIPRLVHMHTAETEESTGLEISWNVKTTDIESFRKEAQFVFFGAPERTTVRNENWKWPALDLVHHGTDFKVYYKGKDESLFEGPYVRMGPVLYPLDSNAIGINTYSQDENWIGEDILILDVPIGAVNIQDSREALGYDDRTIAYLKNRLKEARKEIHAWYQAEIDQIDHIVTAAHFLSKHRHKLLGRVGGSVREWRGQNVPLNLDTNHFKISEATQYWNKMAWGRKRRWGGSEQRRINLNFHAQEQISFDLLARKPDVFIDLGEKKAGERILNAEWGDEKTALWIKTTDADVQNILDYINNPASVTYVRDLPEPPKTQRSRNGLLAGVVKVEVLTLRGRVNREVDEPVTAGWYLKVEKHGSAHLGNSYVYSTLLEQLRDIGVHEVQEIYQLSEAKLKRKYFRKLKELTADELKRMVGCIDFVNASNNKQYKDAYCEIMSQMPGLKLPPDLDAIYTRFGAASECIDTLKFELLNYYGLLSDQEQSTKAPPPPDLQQMIVQRFPLLAYTTLRNTPTAEIQHYIDLMEKSR